MSKGIVFSLNLPHKKELNMKTFLINTAKNLKKISNKLNINSIICSKEWIIFSEDYTAREVYFSKRTEP